MIKELTCGSLGRVNIIHFIIAFYLLSNSVFSQSIGERVLSVYPYVQVPDEMNGEERWSAIMGNFPPNPEWPEGIRQRAISQFNSLDSTRMTPEWRCAYLENKLNWMKQTGDWKGMIAIRDQFMASGINDAARSPLDADILNIIAGFFESTVFVPPHQGKIDDASALEYWKSHYRDVTQAEKISQYVVDHFDKNYDERILALVTLAYCQKILGKHESALASYKQLDSINLKDLKSFDHVDASSKLKLTGKDHHKQKLKVVGIFKRKAPFSVISEASMLPYSKAHEEVDQMKKKYRDDAEVQAAADKTIQSLLNPQNQDTLYRELNKNVKIIKKP